MPRTCTICVNPSRPEIESALSHASSLRDTAAKWSVSKSALARHRHHMAIPEPTTPANGAPVSIEASAAVIAVPTEPLAVDTTAPEPAQVWDDAPTRVTVPAEPAVTDTTPPPEPHTCLIGWRVAGSSDELRCDQCFPPPSAWVRLTNGTAVELGLLPGVAQKYGAADPPPTDETDYVQAPLPDVDPDNPTCASSRLVDRQAEMTVLHRL